MKTNFSAFKSILHKGLQWTFVSTLLLSVLGFWFYILLARYLDPKDFGLFSVCLIILGFLDFFSGAGLSAVLIQEKKLSGLQLSTFFWINLGTGVVLGLILAGIAPLIGAYFNDKILVNLIYIIAIIPVLAGTSLLHNNLLRREIQIEKAEKAEVTGMVVQLITGFIFALNGMGVYTLPTSYVCGKSASGIMYFFFGWKYYHPVFEFEYASVKLQLSSGKYQVFEKFFNYVRANVDKFLIGKFLGADALGYFTLAQKLIEFPLSKINPGLNKILFPYFSRLQHRPLIIAKLYKNIITYLMAIISPFLLFLLFFAREWVSILFDEKYYAIAPLIQILSVLGLLRSFSNIGGNLLIALGKFKVGFIWNFWWALIISCIIYISMFFTRDLVEITYIIFWANFISFFIWHYIIYQYVTFPYKTLITRFILSMLYSTFLAGSLYYIDYQWFTNFEPIVRLILYSLITMTGTLFLINMTLRRSVRLWK